MLLLYQGEGSDANFYHQAGVDIDHAFLLVDKKRKTLFVHKMNSAIARATFKGRVVEYQDPIATMAKSLKGRAVLFDGNSMSARLAEKLKKICRLKDHSEELGRLRIVKTADEASMVAKAARASREIIESVDLSSGKTELDVHKELILKTFEMGLQPAFPPIVSTDASTAFPHYTARRKKLGSLVLIDYGVKFGHYCSDITRCFIRGGDRKKKEQYERLQDICWFLADSLPSMETGKDVAKLSADLIKDAGFPKMIHSIGHGVGLEVHEHPGLGMKSTDSLKGATLAIEPAFYLAGYGMRYEETVFNGGKRARIL
jgi:Xaa-Pro dipeptidase